MAPGVAVGAVVPTSERKVFPLVGYGATNPNHAVGFGHLHESRFQNKESASVALR